MGRILVTGALGNVGGYVAEYLINSGHDVVLAGRDLDVLKQKYDGRTHIVSFDFTNNSTFAQALENVERVFIMRPPHLGNPKDLNPFIDALKATGKIKLVCFLSLLGVEKNPIAPHHKIEKYIEKSGLLYCHIRPSFFMQNISGIHAFEIKHLDHIVVPVKDALTSFIDAEDIGELISKVLSEPDKHLNKPYSITGPEAISYWSVAEILTKVLKRKIIYGNPKPQFAKKYWIDVRGIKKEYVTVMGMLYMMTRFGAAKKVTNVFEDILGRKPQTFEQFVIKNVAAWER